MVSQLTRGIRVSVETQYEGQFVSKKGQLHVFTYDITISNLSPDTVQLLGRHWFIYDTADEPSEIDGDGVVGKQPVLAPGESHRYQSGCHLRGCIGAMKGYYRMMRAEDDTVFEVDIPTFQFFATPRLN